MKIDLHTHILPERWPDLEKRYGYSGFIRLDHHKPCCARMMMGDQFFREIDHNCWSPGQRIEESNRFRVDVQVLSTVPVMFSYWAEPEDTYDLSRILNDHLAKVCRDHPKRFVGLGTLPMQAPDLAIKELERCVKDLGLAGVEIGTHINQWNLDEAELDEFWAAAEALQASIFVHPWDMMGKDRMPRHWLPWLVSMPAETSLAMCSMIMGGVFDRYPNLKVCFAHGGGSFPVTIGRIDHGFEVRPDLCQTKTENKPSSYLDRVYLDSLVHHPKALEFLLATFSANRIGLGTDYPFPLGELSPGALIESTITDYETAERLLSGTALEFLGLERSAFETDASRAHTAWLKNRFRS
ncbi:MAG TPA: 2-amino-3-carboxymuconate-6-semialdehyde decarboxylase [Myxococcales bacterium]|jgi:aminocarboxymuconate-semialdehyde decarboxylase|nr:2-amino-3-carboxymuconate-6-semialdehyde decarboxylase [Myxococcales bacterium]|tara:strand:- start:848 stop:1906 length:1059 start_codon:yes stop_codon:yes gene_type:complete